MRFRTLLTCSFFLCITTSLLAAPPVVLKRLTDDGDFKQRPAWSADGKWLAYSQHAADKIEILIANADGTKPRRLTDRTPPEYDACWSPDSSQLAFSLVSQSGAQGDVDVFTIQPDGSNLTPIAVTGGNLSHEEAPAWSPDGRYLAYSTTRDGNQEIYTCDLQTMTHTRLTSDQALDAHPCWSPDGSRIIFTSARWGNFELAAMPTDGSSVERLTESPGLDDYPAFSPDGKQLAFTSNRDGNFEIYLLDWRTRDLQNVSQHRGVDNFPAWTPSGKLGFVSNRGDGFDIYVQR